MTPLEIRIAERICDEEDGERARAARLKARMDEAHMGIELSRYSRLHAAHTDAMRP